MGCGTGCGMNIHVHIAHFCYMQVNIESDTNNCGACVNNCTNAPNVQKSTCSAGTPGKACGIPADGCAPGFGNCDNNATNGCEVSRASFSFHPNWLGRGALMCHPLGASIAGHQQQCCAEVSGSATDAGALAAIEPCQL
jgi:hypothetical protein